MRMLFKRLIEKGKMFLNVDLVSKVVNEKDNFTIEKNHIFS